MGSALLLAALLSAGPARAESGDTVCTPQGCFRRGPGVRPGVRERFDGSGAPEVIRQASGFTAREDAPPSDDPAKRSCPTGGCPTPRRENAPLSGGPVKVDAQAPPSPCASGRCGAPALSAEAGAPPAAFAAKSGGGGKCGAGAADPLAALWPLFLLLARRRW